MKQTRRRGWEGGEGRAESRVVVEERKKRERPTDRRMRPGEVFNWEEGWNFASLGAVSPSVDGRRSTVPPAQLSPFQDMSLLSMLSLPTPSH